MFYGNNWLIIIVCGCYLQQLPTLPCEAVGKHGSNVIICNEIQSRIMRCSYRVPHYNDVIVGAMTSQITSLTIVWSTVYSGADQIHQRSASLASVREIHRVSVNSPHKWPVTRKTFPFDDVIVYFKETVPVKGQLSIIFAPTRLYILRI